MNRDLEVVLLDGKVEEVPKVARTSTHDGILNALSSADKIIVQYNIRALRRWRLK